MYQAFKIPVLISSVAAVLLLTACNNTQTKHTGMENNQHGHSDSVYTCPMHPEVTGLKGGKCPKCGMDLATTTPGRTAQTELTLTTAPKSIEAGRPAQLSFTFTKEGRTMPLELAHEKKVHLMVVNENLTWFRHIHPQEQADGSYTITETFPAAGKYFLFSDYKAQGATPHVDKKELLVSGTPDNSKPAKGSTKFVSLVDGYTVTLENGNDLKTNRTQGLEISVEKDGKKLSEKDIEPYLAATAHIAMIGQEDKDFQHIHPVPDQRFPVYAETHITQPGIYRIWVEFKTHGTVHTADFTVSAGAGKHSGSEEETHAHH